MIHFLTFDRLTLLRPEKIKAEFPWYWDMKTLVQDRPNRIRTGLGNGDTEIDFDAIMPGMELGDGSEVSSDVVGAKATLNDSDSDGSDVGQVVDSDEEQEPRVQKRRANDSEGEKGTLTLSITLVSRLGS